VGFVQSPEELVGFRARETFDFFDAEALTVYWETSSMTVERLLPPPLEPARRPLVTAFLANYPSTSFGVGYREAALFLRAAFGGEEGGYCLAMSVTDDMALVGGREIFGYPTKLAAIEFARHGQEAGGWAERRGVRFFELRATLGGQPNAEGGLAAIAATRGSDGGPSVLTVYNFKHFIAPDLDGFDYPPRLIREEVEFRPAAVEVGEAEVALRPSAYAPWSEVEVARVLGAVYTNGHCSMRRGWVAAEADAIEFAPYSMLKFDPF
jgi:acetoacetate decarboxylase